MGWSSNEFQGGGYRLARTKGQKAHPCQTLGHSAAVAAFCRRGYFWGSTCAMSRSSSWRSPQSGFAEAAVRHTPGQVLSAIWTSALRPQILIPLFQCPLRRLPPRLVRVGRLLWRSHFDWQWLTGLLRQCCAALQCEPRRTLASGIGSRTASPGGSRQPASVLHAVRWLAATCA